MFGSPCMRKKPKTMTSRIQFLFSRLCGKETALVIGLPTTGLGDAELSSTRLEYIIIGLANLRLAGFWECFRSSKNERIDVSEWLGTEEDETASIKDHKDQIRYGIICARQLYKLYARKSQNIRCSDNLGNPRHKWQGRRIKRLFRWRSGSKSNVVTSQDRTVHDVAIESFGPF